MYYSRCIVILLACPARMSTPDVDIFLNEQASRVGGEGLALAENETESIARARRV